MHCSLELMQSYVMQIECKSVDNIPNKNLLHPMPLFLKDLTQQKGEG